jgi:thiamine-monophosphate kinase
MKLNRLGEFGLIEKIAHATPKGRGVRVGIGDDAAWVTSKSGSCLITADLLLEGVHFDLRQTSLFALGHKTLAVNLSDIAAMGGIAAFFVLSLGIPVNFKSQDIEEFYRGVKSLSVKSGVALVGGDISAAQSLIISACVIGHAPYRPVRRRGARIGHDIYITGSLGDSGLALKLLKSSSMQPPGKALAYLLRRHNKPAPRLGAGLLLAKEGLATAMIDVSDGLLQDLGHICHASRVGAVIWEETLPLSPAYRALAGNDGTRYALMGGEDYELLFCARRRDRSHIENLEKQAQVPITRIGRCTLASEGIKVLNPAGKLRALRTKGYDHFKVK